jgi:hypothetical protein
MTVVVMYSSVNRVDHEKGSGPSKEGVGGRDKLLRGQLRSYPPPNTCTKNAWKDRIQNDWC